MRTWQKALLGLVVVLGVLIGWSWARAPVDPIVWDPPALSPLEGAYAPNARMQPVEWWAKQLQGPEAVLPEPDGGLLAGLKDGRVVSVHPGSDEAVEVVDTHGRPLAMARHPDGRLFICDSTLGLLAFGPKGLETLVTGHGGIPFHFLDDIVISADGLVYFTDASGRHSLDQFTEELLEHRPTGRLLRYDPATGTTTQLADGISFANGVALDDTEQFAVLAETGSYRLWRIELKGPEIGKRTLFTESLSGFPDNVRWSPSRRGFWVAIGSPRKPEVDGLAHWPTIRRVVAGLPHVLQPKPARHAYVLLVDLQGRPVESFQLDSPDSYSPIASATEYDGWLYLGSFAREGLARFKLPPQ